MRKAASVVFCGSDYYSRVFNGITVPLGREPAVYDPNSYDRNSIRTKLGILPDEQVIGFLGEPRTHVGIEDLVRALELLKGSSYRFVLLVAPPGSASNEAKLLFDACDADIRLLENQPSSLVPELLAATDIVVIPQRCSSISDGQLPARLVEAMAMAKAIITTRIADIPQLLNGGGIFVDDRSPQDIADSLIHIANNPLEASAAGATARKMFLKYLTIDAMSEKLIPAIESVLRGKCI